MTARWDPRVSSGPFDLTRFQAGEEIRIESSDGIRYAALAQVAADGIARRSRSAERFRTDV
jgi:hypothetical protein